MKQPWLTNLASATSLVLNLLFPGAIVASADPAARPGPLHTSASLSALPDWFTSPERAQLAATGQPAALPAWFTSAPAPASQAAPASAAALPGWFAPASVPAPAPASEPASQAAPASAAALPGWFAPALAPATAPALSPAAAPASGSAFKPLMAAIGRSILTVNVYSSGVASLGSPLGAGELYTAVIKNTSTVSVAYGVFLTATHQSYFAYDGGGLLQLGTLSGTTTLTPIITSDATAITWTLVPTLDLGIGQVLTLTFRLQALCNAQSGQQMRVGLRYNGDPALPPDEMNDGGVNIITGRGNLVLSKSPSVQVVNGAQYGQPITWNVTVKNTGQGAVFDAYITDTGGISLTGVTGPLTPSAYISRMEINESRTFVVTGTVLSCNFTNYAAATWGCGNLNYDTSGTAIVDAVPTNPVSSTAGILFQPQLPNIGLQLSSNLAYSYCTQPTQTVVLSITNAGGPAASFYVTSTLTTDPFLKIITSSVSPGWQYNALSGTFTYLGGSPTGTLPALMSTPITVSFQVVPQGNICLAGQGQVDFWAKYKEVCNGDPYQSAGKSLAYQYAQGEAPTLGISKYILSSLSPGNIVHSGDVIQYQLVVTGVNPGNLTGSVFISDAWSGGYQITNMAAMTWSAGTAATTTTGLVWSFTPPAGLGDTIFTRTLNYTVEVLPIKGQCNATSNIHNSANVTASQKCTTCGLITQPLPATADVVVVNNEGIGASQSGVGSGEACGLGYTFVNTYTVSGSTVVTWSQAVFTDSMGIGIGYLPLPAGATPLSLTGGLSATISGTAYTLTPTFNSQGQMTVTLTPLQYQGAPTQNLTLVLTYHVFFTEGILNNSVYGYYQNFYDWSQLYLPNVSSQGCAGNNAYNQARYLSVNRGELRVGLSPSTVNQCSTTPVTLALNDLAPGTTTSQTVIVFKTSLPAQLLSTHGLFTYTGSLATYSSTIAVTSDTVAGLITFTLPAGADIAGAGSIQFNLDTQCSQKPTWQATVNYVTQCAVPHSHTTGAYTPSYTTPLLGLFVTPIQYTIDKNTVVWWMLVSNIGDGVVANALVTNTLTNLYVTTYTTDNPGAGVSLSGGAPVSGTALFTITQLQPNESVLIAVTGTVIACDPLRVDVAANLSCLGASCSLRQAAVTYNQPGVYLLSDNSQTADLPMCDVGFVDFRTKNASPAATLYHINLTETLHGLAPAPNAPITLTVVNVTGTVLRVTTAFTPQISYTGVTTTSVFTTTLTWYWDDVNAKGFLDSLDPQDTVLVTIPVQLSCSAGTPQAESYVTAVGPCNNPRSHQELAITLPTKEPDIRLVKTVINPQGNDGGNVAVNPGDVITWHIRLWNNNNGHSYPAKNVVLTDVWPSNFAFITATGPVTYTPYVITPSQFISWNIGYLEVGTAYQKDFYIRGTVLGNACQARTINATRLMYGCDTNSCVDGLAPMDYASVDSNPNLQLAIAPDPVQLCGGLLTTTISNYGARAYTPTLTLTLPAGYVYSDIIGYSPALTLANIFAADPGAPAFQWDLIPERISASGQDLYLPTLDQITPSNYTLTVRLKNSGATGTCPNADAQTVTATITYNNEQICALHGLSTTVYTQSLGVVAPTLDLAKTPRIQVEGVGKAITWLLTLTNTGPGVAENLVVTDVAGGNYMSVTAAADSNGVVPVQAGNAVSWTFATPLAVNGVWTASVSAVLTNTGSNYNVVTATAGCAAGCQAGTIVTSALTSLLQNFNKGPAVQTGTLGSLAVFTFSSSLPDGDALYQNVALTDNLPAGLGYVSSQLSYTYNNSATGLISDTPTLTPGLRTTGPVIWQLGNLSGSVQLNGVITTAILDLPANQAGVSVTNVMTLTYTDTGIPFAYTSTARTDMVEPHLALTKAVGSSTGSLSGLDGLATLLYTLTVVNTGTSPAYSVLVTDAVPAGISVTAQYGSGGLGAVAGPGNLRWDVGVLSNAAPDNTLFLTYTAVVSQALANTALHNVVTTTYWSLTNTTPDSRPYGPITSSQTVTTTNLTFSKSTTPSVLKVGDLVTYTLVFTVPAGEAALGGTSYVTDTLPPGIQVITQSITGSDIITWTPLSVAVVTQSVAITNTTGPNQVLAWTFATPITSQQDTPTVVTLTVPAQATGVQVNNGTKVWPTQTTTATVTNIARLIQAGATIATVTATNSVIQPSLTLVKSSSPASSAYVAGHQTITYSLTLTNTGYARAYDLQITDTLPAGIDYVATLSQTKPATATVTTTVTGQVLTYAISEMDPGPSTSMVLTVVAQVTDTIGAGLYLTNTAALPTYDTQPGQGPGLISPTQRAYTAGLTSAWHQTVNGGITKTLSYSPPPSVTLGSFITYLISVPTSAITATLYNVQITDTVPVSLAIQSVITANSTGGAYTVTGQLVTATFPSVVSNTQAFVTITTILSDALKAQAGNILSNTAWLSTSAGLTNTSVITCRVAEPTLTLVKASLPPTSNTVGAGALVTYVVTATNASGINISPAYSLTFTDTLPVGMRNSAPTLQAVTLNGVGVAGGNYLSAYDPAGIFTVTFTPAYSVPVAGRLVITYVARVDGDVSAQIDLTNTAQMGWSSLPGGTAGLRSYTPVSGTAILHSPKPSITKTVTPAYATLGDVLTYTLQVPQTGFTATVNNAVVTDTLSAYLQLWNVYTDGTGVVTQFSNTFTVTYGTIPSNTLHLITVTAVLSQPRGASAGLPITNMATLSHSSGLTVTNQPVFTVTEPSLSRSKASNPLASQWVYAAQTVTYTIRLTNTNNLTTSAAYDLRITDTLPYGMQAQPPVVLGLTLSGTAVAPTDIYTGYVAPLLTVTVPATYNIPVGGALVLSYTTRVDTNVPAGLRMSNLMSATWSSLPGPISGDKDYGPLTATTPITTPGATALAKGVTPTLATIGSVLVYTLAVPSPVIGAVLSNVVVTDTFDARLTVTSATASVGTTYINGQVVTAALGTLAPNAQAYLTLTAVVRDLLTTTTGTTITNIGQMNYTNNPSGPLTSPPVTTTLAQPVVPLTKSVQTSRQPSGAGDTVTYTLALSNTGNWPAYDLLITDALPAGVTFLAMQTFTVTSPLTATPSTSAVAGDSGAAWTVDQLNVGGYITLAFTARISDAIGAALRLTNTAWGAYDNQFGFNAGQRYYTIPTATVPITTGLPSLVLRKTAAPVPAMAGQPLTYTLWLTNTGVVSATGVVITDRVPVNTVYVDCGPLPCGQGAGVVAWTLGTVDIGVSRSVTLAVSVTAPLPNNTVLTNLAWVTSTEGVTATTSLTTPVQSQHVLSITKSAAPSPVQAGQLLTYTLLYTVTGNETALGVTLSDTVPQSTTFVSATPPGNVLTAPAVGGTGLVAWQFGALTPTASGAVTLVVQVDSPLVTGTVLFNQAAITDTNNGVTDTTSLTTPVQSQHVLTVVKSATPNPVQAGQWLTYFITYTVTGNETALGVTLSDTVPQSTTFVSAAPPGNVLTAPAVGGTGLVAWQFGALTPTASGSVTLVVSVTDPLADGSLLTNVVTITDTNGGLTDTFTHTTLVGAFHWLTVTKQASANPVTAGAALTYAVAYTVTGNEVAQGVLITDTLPPSTTFQACQPVPICGETSPGSGVVAWTLGALNPFNATSTGLVTVVVTVAAPLPNGAVLTNTATITDTNHGYTDTTQLTTTVASSHTLLLTKTVSAASITAGGALTYTLNWSVSGNETAQGVVIHDPLPANTVFLTASAPGAFDGVAVSWPLSDQVPGASGAVSYSVLVTTPLPNNTLIVNTAAITDTNQGLTHTDTITTVVVSSHTLVVVKSGSADPVAPGDLLTYTLAYTATGSEPAQGVTLSDTVPPHTTFVAATPPYTQNGTLITWPRGTLLAAGSAFTQETGVVTLAVRVDTPLTNGLNLVNLVLITDTTSVSDTDTLTTTVTAQHLITLTKSAAPSPVQAGALLTYTLAYTATGDGIANRVTLSDTVPPSTTFVACAPFPCSLLGGLVTWSLGALAPPTSGAATLVVRVAAPLLSGTVIANRATLTDTELITPTDSITTVVSAMPDVTVVKVDAGVPTAPGDVITYTLAYSNLGNQTAQGVILTETVPSNTTFNPAASHPAWVPVGGGVYTYFVGAVNPVGVVTFGVTVSNPLPPGITSVSNTVVIGDNGVETNTINNRSTFTTPITNAAPDFVVTKDDGQTLMWPGSVVTYVIRYTNTGNIAAASATLTETVPTYTVFNAAASQPTLWSCADASGPGTLCTATVGAVAGRGGAGSVTFAITAALPFPANAGPITNSVSIDTDTTPGDNTGSDIDLPALPAVIVRKTLASANPAYLSDLVTFTIQITNTGVTTLTTLPMTDTFDSAYLAFVSATPAPDQIAPAQLRWTNLATALGALPPGQSRQIVAVMRAIAVTPAGVQALNTASVDGVVDIYRQQPQGGGGTSQIGVTIIPNLALSKVALGGPFTVRDVISFTIQITNLGSTTVLTLPLVDTYNPAYLGYVSAQPPPTAVTPGQITWADLTASLGDLPPHGTLSVQVVFTAVAPISNTLNTATIINAIDDQGTVLTSTTTARVPIRTPPTAVQLLYFRAQGIDGRQVSLAWATASEIDHYGFRLYRAPVNDRYQAELIHFEPPAVPGGSSAGASYHYTDVVPTDGAWWYWLADVDTHGMETFHTPVRVGVGIESAYWMYLPMMMK